MFTPEQSMLKGLQITDFNILMKNNSLSQYNKIFNGLFTKGKTKKKKKKTEKYLKNIEIKWK